MDNTFSKSINGRDLQFNRYLYPTRYTIKLDEFGSDGKQYELNKDSEAWVFDDVDTCPDWLKDMSQEINKAILKNESNLS